MFSTTGNVSVRPSVRPYVRPSLRPSVPPSEIGALELATV